MINGLYLIKFFSSFSIFLKTSSIPIYDLDSGTIYASRVAAVLSLNGKPIKYLQFGPFLNYYNEKILTQFQFIKLKHPRIDQSNIILIVNFLILNIWTIF